MKAYFNGRYFEEEEITLNIRNRSFLYGDGFFETMIGHAGKVKLLYHHLERISQGLKTMMMKLPMELIPHNCAGIISELFYANNIKDYARIKIVAWRRDGGTYLPQNDRCNIIITIKEINKPVTGYKHQVCFSEKIKNCRTEISRFKSLSAQNYVLAALEMKEKKADEIIITDIEENISECLVSNIFWVKDGTVFTPTINSGCVEGVSRTVILEELFYRDIPVERVSAKKEELLEADNIFCTNALGISHILKIEDRSFDIYRKIEEVYKPF